MERTQIAGGGICISIQFSEGRKEVYNMTLEEALTRFAEGLENVEDYDEEFEFIRGMNNGNVEDSEEYKKLDTKYNDLKEKYNDLKEKYKKKFIESLTKSVGEIEEENEEEDEEEKEIKIEDLDLTGIND